MGLRRAVSRLKAGGAELTHIAIDFRRSQSNLFIVVHGHLPARIKKREIGTAGRNIYHAIQSLKIYTGTPSFARHYALIPEAKKPAVSTDIPSG